MPLFSLSDVRLAIDGNTILDGASVDVPGGALVVIAGASGAGKSTILRLLNRLEVPDSGSVRFNGVPLSEQDPLVLRRRVGMVFQRPTPFDGSIRANFHVADPTLDDDACRHMLDRVHLPSDFLERDARTLSGGESQRACVARTLCTQPDVVLMDEATASLDEQHRLGIERLGRDLVDSGVWVVWVSHDRDQIDRIADVVIEVDRGRIVGVRS